MYNRPVLSPDGKRVVVIKGDLDKETNDVWILDVATGPGNTDHNRLQPREASQHRPSGLPMAVRWLTFG